MHAVYALARRDLISAFTTPMAWLVLTAWTLLTNGVFVFLAVDPAARGLPSGDPLVTTTLAWGAWLMILIAPALTMTAFASERSQGTLQLLFTVPVDDGTLVLGKYDAGAALLLTLLAATLPQVAVLWWISDPGGAHTVVAYLGTALALLTAAAIGTWISALVEGPVPAYVLTFGVLALLQLLGLLAQSEGPLAPIGEALGWWPRLEGFIRGEARVADALYFVGLTAVALQLAHAAVGLRRRNG
jgi:ABC-2 type transport system permease protein